MDDRVTLGRISGVYGIRGWVRIASQTRPADRILKYRRWWIQTPAGSYESAVVSGHLHGASVVAQLADAAGAPISDRDQAARLVGAEVAVERQALPKLPKGEYYWVDLIGLGVENQQQVALGVVRDMTSNGAQDVLVVEDAAGVTRLIPFVRPQIVSEVDLQARRIVCDWQPDY